MRKYALQAKKAQGPQHHPLPEPLNPKPGDLWFRVWGFGLQPGNSGTSLIGFLTDMNIDIIVTILIILLLIITITILHTDRVWELEFTEPGTSTRTHALQTKQCMQRRYNPKPLNP